METIQDGNYMINDLASKTEESFAGRIISFEQEGNKFTFTCDNKVKMYMHVITDKVVRFRFATAGRFEDDFSYAFDSYPDEKVDSLDFKEKDDHFRITTERIIIVLQKQNCLSRILDKSGNVLSEDEKGFHWEYNKTTGSDIVMMSKAILSGEHFHGLGDKSYDLDLRGKRFENWGSDTYGYGKKSDPLYKNIPFFLSLHKKIAYGIFFDNSFRSFFDFGMERSNVYSFWAQGGEMNYYFIYGPSMMEVVQDYTNMTGTPELPPLWALGFHQCKWSYYPEAKVKEITNGFRSRNIPCDAIYLDIDYMEGFRCFTWSKEYFPDPKRMVSELKKDGFKTVVIIDPGIKIDDDYWVYQEGLEKGYFCKRADGPLMKGSVWPGLCNFPDFTKPEVRDWWADLFKELIGEVGVQGVWNDMNEPAVFEDGTFPDDVRFDYDGHPCSHRKGHNVYGMQMARATYMGVKKFANPDRPFIITRSGYAGMQRYSSVWTGDNVASWEHLIIANTQCQRLATSGISFAGSDIGGFIETPTGEMFVRWIQMGIFHPFCRVHSSGDHGDQEPWSYGDEYTDLVRKFIELRYQLLPYIYTSFWQYHKYGTPMLRQLQMMDQKDIETYYRQEEFGVGDNLLVCPIAQSNAEGRWLYLPKGDWFYYWDDSVAEGKDEVWANADLNQVPLYVRAGSVLPHYPVQQYVGEKKIEILDLHVYYIDGRLRSSLYEDAGNGYGYENGDFNEKRFTVLGDEISLRVDQKIEGGFSPEYTSYNLIFHGLPSNLTKIKLGDEQDAIALKKGKWNNIAISTASVPLDFQTIIVC